VSAAAGSSVDRQTQVQAVEAPPGTSSSSGASVAGCRLAAAPPGSLRRVFTRAQARRTAASLRPSTPADHDDDDPDIAARETLREKPARDSTRDLARDVAQVSRDFATRRLTQG